MTPRAALLVLLLSSSTAGAAPLFELEGVLARDERAATLQLLDEATSRLPPAWREALDEPVRVQWRQDLPEGVHGRARNGKVMLDRRLLAGWMTSRSEPEQGTGVALGPDFSAATPAPAPVVGGDVPARAAPPPAAALDPASRAALAAVLHELAHLYDRSRSGGLSQDPHLLDLAGWQVAALRPGRGARNDFSDRSPDPYELHSPREYVAVNLEHYLLDPEYACRRPALAAYFDTRFGRNPQAAGRCAPGLAFVQDAVDEAEPLRLLDPGRIFEVHYLLAEGNERPMSRWGHSMLRLVVCAPGRARGPDCRLDLQHHLVLSFRAFVDDLQISSWRGLTGRYPSRLFALPLEQVLDEYNRVELRGVRSLPLSLSRAEIAALAGRAAQLHWSYDGRYYFVSNNCAVETWKLLHDTAPRLAALPLASVTPTALARRLQAQGLVDGTQVPAEHEAQVRLGFYFEPASAHLEQMYAVARRELGLEPPSAQAWLALEPRRRSPAIGRAGLRAGAALLVLESAALRRQEALARDELKRQWLGRRGMREGLPDDAAWALEDFLRLGGAFSRPAAWLEGVPGYGLPQAGERQVLAARARQDAAARSVRARQLEGQFRQWLSAPQREALERTEANLAVLGERLRVLGL